MPASCVVTTNLPGSYADSIARLQEVAETILATHIVPRGALVCFANVSDESQRIDTLTLIDLLADARHDPHDYLALPAHGVAWLRE